MTKIKNDDRVYRKLAVVETPAPVADKPAPAKKAAPKKKVAPRGKKSASKS